MTQHGMVSYNTAKEGAGYNVLSPYGHGNYLRVLKDAYWSRFCSKGKSSMLFITFRCFRSFVIHCVKEDGEEDDRPTYSMTMQGLTLLMCVLRGFRRMAGEFSPSTL